MVSSVQISSSLCVILEHTHVSQGWNVYVVSSVQISGSLCVVLEHTRVSGGISKWLAQFK